MEELGVVKVRGAGLEHADGQEEVEEVEHGRGAGLEHDEELEEAELVEEDAIDVKEKEGF